MKGRVKAFDEGKGYGFIEGEDGREYLVHFTAVRERGVQLSENVEVEFDPVNTRRGLQAAEVRRAEN